MLGLGRDIRSRYRNCFLNDELTSRLMKHDNIIKTITNDRILFDCRIWYIVLLRIRTIFYTTFFVTTSIHISNSVQSQCKVIPN